MNWFKLLAELLKIAGEILSQQAQSIEVHPLGVAAGPKDRRAESKDIIRSLRQLADNVERDLQRDAMPPAPLDAPPQVNFNKPVLRVGSQSPQPKLAQQPHVDTQSETVTRKESSSVFDMSKVITTK